MSSYIKLAEAGGNYRPAPWKVDKTIFYWGDPSDAPGIPRPKDWKLLPKKAEGTSPLKCSLLR